MEITITELGIAAFIAKFPSLKDADGSWPWNPDRFDIWAEEPERTENQLHSARYILELWDSTNDWSCGAFDLNAAAKAWDAEHQQAYMQVSELHDMRKPS